MHSSSRKEHSGEEGTRCTLPSQDLLDRKLLGDCSFNRSLLRVNVLGAQRSANSHRKTSVMFGGGGWVLIRKWEESSGLCGWRHKTAKYALIIGF